MNSIFIIGAGFSKPAGLPLGTELFQLILDRAKITGAYQTLKRDIDQYLNYYNNVNGQEIKESEINFEEFMSYLDIEHFLQLKGSDTFSSDGNRSQLIIKKHITQILYEKIFNMDNDDYAIYESFADKLEPYDTIITFNYDTILENCFERLEIPYRFFLDRFKSVGPYTAEPAEENTEVVLLKMHGSIDWFDIENHESNFKIHRQDSRYIVPEHPIFSNKSLFKPEKIIDGPYPSESKLNNIYRVKNIKRFIDMDTILASPLILSPSFSKIVYLNPLREFWYSFNTLGTYLENMGVIGFSLAEHDEYIKQPIHNLINTFQTFDASHVLTKKELKVVECRKNLKEVEELKNRYSFIDWDKTKLYTKGFSKISVEKLFK
jgi:hypothetical protein